jgi:hypothetical protein
MIICNYSLILSDHLTNTDKIIYKSFWTDDKYVLDKYFNTIISEEVLNKYNKIIIFSVFADGPFIKEDNTLYIHYSGEPFYHKNDIYDLYLVADKTNYKNVIAIPLMQYELALLNEDLIYKLKNPRVYNNKTKFALFVNSNGSCDIRNNFFFKLNDIKKVDAAGSLFNNMDGISAPRDREEYFNFAKEYKFQLCFENNSVDYYLTEKILNAYINNTIPIYWGCPQVFELLNKKAFLCLPPEPTEEDIQKLIDKIIEIDNNDELYKEIFNEPLIIHHDIPNHLDCDFTKMQINRLFYTNK